MKNHLRLTFACSSLIALLAAPFSVQTASANELAIFTDPSAGWIQFANDDTIHTVNGNFVDPGYGGQDFDAEYLYYKRVGNTLWFGLQTGFDLMDGKVTHSNVNYWTGDLALSFDGTPTTYEYAVDFGLQSKTYDGSNANQLNIGGNSGTPGIDNAGLYQVSTWNTGVYSGFTASNPLAMQSGTLKSGSDFTNDKGSGLASDVLTSYYRIVSFSLADIGLQDTGFTLGAHWTMSCGNDAINGNAPVAPVPEPATMLLFGTGLIGLAGLVRRKE